MHMSAVQISKHCLFTLVLSDLITDQMFSDIAKQQAGIQEEIGFQITNFNYNVSIIPNRTKLHLGDICFDGLSVLHKN